MRADNTRHLRAAVQRRQHDTRERALAALSDHQRRNIPLTVAGLARAAHVTRSWIYTQADLLAAIHDGPTTAAPPPARTTATDDSWQRRLELAHARIRELTGEVQNLRTQLALTHGQLRAANAASQRPHLATSRDEDMSTTRTRR